MKLLDFGKTGFEFICIIISIVVFFGIIMPKLMTSDVTMFVIIGAVLWPFAILAAGLWTAAFARRTHKKFSDYAKEETKGRE